MDLVKRGASRKSLKINPDKIWFPSPKICWVRGLVGIKLWITSRCPLIFERLLVTASPPPLCVDYTLEN